MYTIIVFLFFQKSLVPIATFDDNTTIHSNVPCSNKFGSLEDSGQKIALSSIHDISVAVASNKVLLMEIDYFSHVFENIIVFLLSENETVYSTSLRISWLIQ